MKNKQVYQASDNYFSRAFKISYLVRAFLFAFVIVVIFFSLLVGVAPLSPSEIGYAILNLLPFFEIDTRLSNMEQIILWQWRAPRVLLAFFVGGSLALAGAGFQGIFRNPLADPFLLGAAAGAGLGATIVMVSNLDAVFQHVDFVPLGAFVGALGATAIAVSVGRLAGNVPASLLLAGVATAAFLTACQTYLMQRNLMSLQEIYGWLIGRLSTSGWNEVIVIVPYYLLFFCILFLHRRELDLLRLSEEEALSLGGNPKRTRYIVIISCAFLTAIAVSVSGLIAFVGIIVPHLIRLGIGYSYRLIIPLSALLGGIFLVLADIFARVIVAPAELPIGVITAFLGAPFFACILVLARGKI